MAPELRFGVLRSAFCVLRSRTQKTDLRFGLRFEFAFRLRFGCFLNTSHAVIAFWNCVLSDMACKYRFVWFGHFGLRSGLAFWVAFWSSLADSLVLVLRFGVAFWFLSKIMFLFVSISPSMAMVRTHVQCNQRCGWHVWGLVTLRIVCVCSLYASTTCHSCVVYMIHIIHMMWRIIDM